MKIAVVSNIDNGKGLERDFLMFREFAQALGHEVRGFHFEKAPQSELAPNSFDLVVFMETAPERFFGLADRRWLIPNLEWWDPRNNVFLSEFDRVGCKTKDALDYLSEVCETADFLGWASLDRNAGFEDIVPAQDRVRRFVCVAGDSILKGAQDALDAWTGDHDLPELVLVTPLRLKPSGRTRGKVEVVDRLADAALVDLLRTSAWHLQPSKYEGFGHCLHEVLSVGGWLVTTDAGPMRECLCVGSRIPAQRGPQMRAATTWTCAPSGIAEVCRGLADVSERDMQAVYQQARQSYVQERADFEARLRSWLSE